MDLLNTGLKYKQMRGKKHYSRSVCALKSIDSRPEAVLARGLFGHWELEMVQGGSDTANEYRVTMRALKTRKEIAAVLSDAKASSMAAFVGRLSQSMGSEAFRRMLVTIPCGGGSEFVDAQGRERSWYEWYRLYVAYLYSDCGLGTNENHN